MAKLMARFRRNKQTFDLENQLKGTIYGNCIGDAIGLLSEFMSKETAKEYYGKKKGRMEYKHKVDDMHRLRWKNGDWTDDSDQMILIMDSLCHSNGKLDFIDYANRLLDWVDHGFPELGDSGGMGLGATTHKVVRHSKFTTDPHHAAEVVWERSNRKAAPNGAVMRTSVLGVFKYYSLEDVKKNAIDICKVTHADPRCQASVVAVTTAIALMLQRPKHLMKKPHVYDIEKLIGEAYEHAKEVFVEHEDAEEAMKNLHTVMFATNISDHELADDPKIGYTYKAMGAGFWALRQTDFRKAMETIILEGGDADTNCAVAGALLGCKLGTNGFPESWLNGLVHKDWLDDKIDKFMKVFNEDLKENFPNEGEADLAAAASAD